MKREIDLCRKLELAQAECARLREENERLRKQLSTQAAAHSVIQPDESSAVPGRACREFISADERWICYGCAARSHKCIRTSRKDSVASGTVSWTRGCLSDPLDRTRWSVRIFSGCNTRRNGGLQKFKLQESEMLSLNKCGYPRLPAREANSRHLSAPLGRDLLVSCPDFDKQRWQTDVSAFLTTCREFDLPAGLERSRSGNGGHVWLFFESPIPASTARKLGCYFLTKTMERRHSIGLDSYDRLFPNQDTMPKGDFGNLIALPLQSGPRAQGNSVFVDDDLQPYADQWMFLSTVRKLRAHEVESILSKVSHSSAIVGVRTSDPDSIDEPWALPDSAARFEALPTGPLPDKVRLIQSNLIYVEKRDLPSTLLNSPVRLAAFQNGTALTPAPSSIDRAHPSRSCPWPPARSSARFG